MEKTKIRSLSVKALSIVATLALILGTLFVPMMFDASAADETAVYDFETASGTVVSIEGGKHFIGNSFSLQERDGKGVLMSWNPGWTRAWATSDACLLNKNNGETYKLKAGDTYMVTFKMKVAAPVKNDKVALALTATSEYYCGYGFTDGNGDPWQKMDKKLFRLVSVGLNAAEYTADDMIAGTATYPVGADLEYHTQTYVFTAPEDAEGKEFGLFGFHYYGTDIRFDEISITDIGTENGIVAAVNILTGEETFYYGKKGTEASIAPLADVGERPFKGFFNEDGTEEIGTVTFGDTIQAVYGYFGGNATITFDALGITETKSGAPDDEIVFPEVPGFSGESKFIGWFYDEAGNKPFDLTAYGIQDRTVYAVYSKQVTVTCHDTFNIKNIKLQGYPGDPIELPQVRDNKHASDSPECRLFVDWYTSSEFDYTYSALYGSTFPKANVDVYSQWKQTASISEPFESYAEPGRLGHGEHMPIKKDIGVEGSKGVYYHAEEDPTTNSAGNIREWKDGFIRVADLTKVSGVRFKASVQMKVLSCDCDFDVALNSATSVANYWENGHAEAVTTISKDCPKNEWLTLETEYLYLPWYNTSGTEFTPKSLYIKLLNTNKGDFEVIFDNFNLEAAGPATETAAVLHLMNDGGFTTDGETITDINYVDEPVAFPENFEFEGRAFLGWSTDRAGTNIVLTDITGGGMKHGGSNIILWAQWDRSNDPDPSTMQGFENYPHDSTYPTFGRKILDVVDDFKLHGEHSLRLRYDEAARADGAALNQLANCFNLMNIENNTQYRVSFKYYAKRSDSDVALRPATSTANIWSPSKNTGYTSAYTIPKGTEPGWKEGEFFFTSDLKESNEPLGTLLFMLVTLSNNEGAEIYFDDFCVEPCDYSDKVLVTFNYMNNCQNTVTGAKGDAIPYPATPSAPRGKQFGCWALDMEGKQPFNDKTFTSDATVYAIFEPAGSVLFTYEDYTYSAQYATCDANCITTDKAYSGNHVFEIDRKPEDLPEGKTLNNSGAHWPLADSAVFNITAGYNYVVTFKYMIVEPGTSNGKLTTHIADTTNLWHQGTSGSDSEYFTIASNEQKGVWLDGSYAFDYDFSQNLNAPDRRGIYMNFKGFNNGIVWFDDINLIALPKGQAGIAVKQNGWSKVPLYVTAAPEASYESKLPKDYSRPNYRFVAYAKGAENISEFKAPFYGTNIIARWAEKEIIQNFDETYLTPYMSREDYCVTDFDWELYDSQKAGNSKNNVTSGRYSLHRKGESMWFEAACLLNSGRLSENDRYTVTFKVKMDSYKQTDGAVKFASNRSSKYPWHTSGEWYPIIAIADLTDGEWHEVSYTFNSVEGYATIMTPGYCSIFIDDVKFNWVDENTPLSEPCTFTEYVVAERDENGNIIEKGDTTVIDVDSIVDASLAGYVPGKNDDGGNSLLWIIIAAAAAVVVGGGLTIFFIAKKKKKEKEA